MSDVVREQLFLLSYSTWRTVIDAERGLLATAKFLVISWCDKKICLKIIITENRHVALKL